MREIPVPKLRAIPELPCHVLHRSGTPLFKPGEALTDAGINILADLSIDEVVFLEADERLAEARRTMTHVSMPAGDLNPGDKLSRTIYDDQGRLLIEAGAAIPKNFASSLERHGITTIYFQKSEEVLKTKEGRKARKKIEELLAGKAEEKEQVVSTETLQQLEAIELTEATADDLDAKKLQAKIDKAIAIEVAPTGEPFAKQVRDPRKEGPASAEVKEAFKSDTGDSLQDIREVFASLQNGSRNVSLLGIDRVANRAMGGVIQNRDLLMLCGTQTSKEEYIVSHSLAMTVVAVNVGTSMGFGAAQIKSLAYGAMLADVGLLKVPTEILEKQEKLAPAEHAEIRRHPAYGLDILQRVNKIPVEVPYIVYQSHERANGTGYPGGKKDVVIHTFAKIVTVADIYASICAHRPYRPAKTPYEAMEALVLMCGKREINADVVRNFLACNSMFPVGSFIRLSDGRAGRVVAANPENYMKPIVAVLVDADQKPLGKPERVDLLEVEAITVKQALTAGDLPLTDEDGMLGF